MNWISIKDKLPALATPVICYEENTGRVFEAELQGNLWLIMRDRTWTNQVTFWMYFPKPPI